MDECLAVGFKAGFEGGAGDVGVGVVASPGVECGVLEGASEGKSDWPGERTVLLHGGEIIGSLLDGLPTREEHHAGELGRDVVFKNFGGGSADCFRGGWLGPLFAGEAHIDF